MSSFEHTVTKPCTLCGGKGTVDPEFVCPCGRPATRQVGAALICTSDKCEKLASEPFSEVEDENKKWWEEARRRGLFP